MLEDLENEIRKLDKVAITNQRRKYGTRPNRNN